MRALVAATVMSFLIITEAFAGTGAQMIGGPIHGSSSQAKVYCYFLNAQSIQISVGQGRIWDEGGNVISLTYNGCGTRHLGPYQSCVLVADVTNAVAHSCELFAGSETAGATAFLTGTIQIFDAQLKLLLASPLTYRNL